MGKKMEKDAGPDGQKRMPGYDGDDDSVEGHQTHKGRDAGPEGQKHLPSVTGEDDDVEGHNK